MKAADCTTLSIIRPCPTKYKSPLKRYKGVMKSLSFSKILLTLALMLGSVTPLCAQAPSGEQDGGPKVGSGRMRAVKGYYLTEIDGEQTMMMMMNEVTVYPPLKFKNKKEEEFYWRTVRDVKRALPYAKVISETMIETYEYIETLPTEKEREAHLKQMEHEVFEEYKPALKKFTKSQAQMLCKLINRETDQSGYNILKSFLGTFRAGFWQAFGRLFGVNLKTDYRPDKDSKDAIIERVAVQVEQGLL